jgi:phosphoesterase RecJ-like protein
MDEKQIETVKKNLWEANNILITSHKRPDGDAIGSVLGLGLALQDAGKEVQMVLADGVPRSFRHLSGYNQISKRPKCEFDISVILDCSDFQRVGNIFEEEFVPNINIDHHVTNLNFAHTNIVNISAPATAEILTEMISGIGLEITKPIAEALLTGLITDTLGFRTPNMHPTTLRVAADLMEFGCDLSGLYKKALLNRSFAAARYWGAGLSTIKLEDRLLWATLTQEDRKTIGYPGRDDADLINVLSSINDVDIAIIFVEQPNGFVKVSWRAQEGFDVSQIAFSFGGGGHKPAAGAEIKGNLEDVKTEVLNTTRNILDNLT